MSWSDKFQSLKKQQPAEPGSGPTSVQSLSAIPAEATPRQVFRLPVDVVRVDERETKGGEPCYFLHVRDADGLRFSIVCWVSQWGRLQERVTVGRQATLDVKVPADGFDSFTLAEPGWRPH